MNDVNDVNDVRTRSRGRVLLRALLVAALVVTAVALLFTVVFPWFDQTFVNDPVLGQALGRNGAR